MVRSRVTCRQVTQRDTEVSSDDSEFPGPRSVLRVRSCSSGPPALPHIKAASSIMTMRCADAGSGPTSLTAAAQSRGGPITDPYTSVTSPGLNPGGYRSTNSRRGFDVVPGVSHVCVCMCVWLCVRLCCHCGGRVGKLSALTVEVSQSEFQRKKKS